ncbi:TPA: Glu-tRNA(Gln) amidotransferase subunit GatE [Candidatus Micrarchaeota archaeon]|nr:Glu-tRNA(Gln) amidotransferase subunit GatE [Candidatus Micrarchaeota archaeon]
MKCGIEIHQRIFGKKLFCGCLPRESEGQQGAQFSRKQHAVLSELGEIDAASRLEAIRSREFQYSAPRECSCLVEADEEPPHMMNREALHAVLVFCTLLHSKPVDRLHVMRKHVIDGSNTSGFQRTAVASLGGAVETPSGKLEIQSICIEEESAGIIEGRESRAAYDLGRLGIPLVEIATAPDLKSGKEAEQAALAIGTLLRKTGLVQRGIGTIRQDLNVSIPEGARVEIKGVQALDMVEKTIGIEVERQKRVLEISGEAKRRLGNKEIALVFVDLTDVFSGTKSQLVSKSIKNGGKVLGMKLDGHSALLGKEIAPNRRFGTELSDYARAAGISGLIHSDEDLAKYGFSDDEIAEAKVALGVGASDAFAMVAGEHRKCQSALSEVTCRANYFGVPEETRKANPDGTSSYLRPLPGKARLYPETDLPPIEITKEMLAEAAKAAAATRKMEEKQEELLSNVNDELASQLASAKGLLSHNPSFKLIAQTPELSLFAQATKEGTDAKLVASTLTNTLQSLKREEENVKALDEPRLLSAFAAARKNIFAKSAMAMILRAMCRNPALGPEDAARELNLEKITGKALEKLISDEKLDLKGLMAAYRLRVDATEAQEIFKRKN